MTERNDSPLPPWWEDAGEGPPIVLVHGYGGNSVTWEPWRDALSRRFRFIPVELPGFGRGPVPEMEGWSVPDLARPLTRLLHHLDLRDATLVGHSLGGAVILATALELMDDARGGGPRRLGRLVSVGGAAYRQKPPPFVRLADLGGLAALGFRLVPKKTLVRGVYRSIVEREDAISEARVEAYAAPLRRPEVQRAALEVARNLFGPEVESFTARYPDIDVPLLCLWGDRDPVVPTWVGQRLAAEVPGGRYVELERCGHQVTEECPKASLRHLLDFMAETGAG